MVSKKTGMKFTSSSEFANEKVVFPELKDKYGYTTPEECFQDRVNHRKEWFDLICKYNEADHSRLTKELLQTSDIYVGMRNVKELQKSAHLFDAVVWVDALGRLPKEPLDSCNVGPVNATHKIDNNSTLEHLDRQVDQLLRSLKAA